MAQSLIALHSETVFAECRAFVFFYDIQLNRWSEVAEPNIYSRIQLLCSRPSGSTGVYRLLGRLETTGMVRSMVNWLIGHIVSSLISLNLFHIEWRESTNCQKYQSLWMDSVIHGVAATCSFMSCVVGLLFSEQLHNTGPLLIWRCIYLVARLARQWMKI